MTKADWDKIQNFPKISWWGWGCVVRSDTSWVYERPRGSEIDCIKDSLGGENPRDALRCMSSSSSSCVHYAACCSLLGFLLLFSSAHLRSPSPPEQLKWLVRSQELAAGHNSKFEYSETSTWAPRLWITSVSCSCSKCSWALKGLKFSKKIRQQIKMAHHGNCWHRWRRKKDKKSRILAPIAYTILKMPACQSL